MPSDLNLVGATATASKRDAQLRGTEVLVSIELEPSENGGFTVRQRYRVEPPAGRKIVDCANRYVEPKTFTFESVPSLFNHLRSAIATLPTHTPASSTDSDDEAYESYKTRRNSRERK